MPLATAVQKVYFSIKATVKVDHKVINPEYLCEVDVII